MKPIKLNLEKLRELKTQKLSSSLIIASIFVFAVLAPGPACAFFEPSQVTTNAKSQTKPDVSGDLIVWTDYRNGNNDIYYPDYVYASGADLCVSQKDIPDPVKKDNYLTYFIKAENYGTDNGTGVVVSDTLDSSVEFHSAISSRGGCSESGGVVTCNIGDIAVGESINITIVVRTTVKGTVTNTVAVAGNETDPFLDNNTSMVTTKVNTFTIHLMDDDGWLPSVAVDSLGKVHISYTREGRKKIIHLPGHDWLIYSYNDIYYMSNKSGTWEKERIHEGWGWTGCCWWATRWEGITSAIAIDNNDNVHIAYVVCHEGVYGDITYYLRYKNNVGGSWNPYETIAENPVGYWDVMIDIDQNDKVHVSYIKSWGAASSGDLVYITNASGSWQTQTVTTAYDNAGMAVDSNNHAHLSFYNFRFGGLIYRTNAPDGTWEPFEPVDPNWSGCQLEGMVTDLAIDSLNRPHISFVSGGGQCREDNMYAVKNGNSWNLTRLDIGGTGSFGNSIAIDSSDKAHVCYYHMPSGELKYATNASSLWTKEYITGDAGWYNDIAAGSTGGVHIVYDSSYEGPFWYAGLAGSDGDYDGASDSQEQGPDGSDPNYDGNGDGTPDAQQNNVTSLHTYDGTAYITVECPNDVMLSNVTATGNPSPDDAPNDVNFVYHFLSFSIYNLEPGGSVTITLYLPEGAEPTTYYKYGPTTNNPANHWYEFMYDTQSQTGAVINGNVVTLHFVDGQRGDDDLQANGVIIEPGGPGEPVPPCIVDFNDFATFCMLWLVGAGKLDADFDGSGTVDFIDLAYLTEHWLKDCPRDWPWK